MNEQEIIDLLKDNQTKGIALGFMPEEVKAWCNLNSHRTELLVYKFEGWLKIYAQADPFCNEDILALPYDYGKKENKGNWVEFAIDQRGNFRCFKDDDMHYFFWANWGIFLKAFSDEFTAFGGWQYKNCKAWYMSPKMLLSDAIDTHYADVLFQGEQAECMPAIPVKIRFWREVK